MGAVPTLILSPRQTPDSQALWRAAIEKSWEVHRLATWRVPDELRAVDEAVLYAEALFGPSLADELGIELLDPAEDWLSRLPEAFRRRSVRHATLAAAMGLREPAFVKPPNDKSFPAAVYAPGALPTGSDPDMAVLIAEPVHFVSEHRCFVLDGAIRTHSIYARNGDPTTEPASDAERADMLAFAQELLASPMDIPRACVLDCGLIRDRGWAAVELNAAWGAGIYGCDPGAVLDVVRGASRAAPRPR